MFKRGDRVRLKPHIGPFVWVGTVDIICPGKSTILKIIWDNDAMKPGMWFADSVFIDSYETDFLEKVRDRRI